MDSKDTEVVKLLLKQDYINKGKENTCLAENFALKVDRSFRKQEIWPLVFHSKPF